MDGAKAVAGAAAVGAGVTLVIAGEPLFEATTEWSSSKLGPAVPFIVTVGGGLLALAGGFTLLDALFG